MEQLAEVAVAVLGLLGWTVEDENRNLFERVKSYSLRWQLNPGTAHHAIQTYRLDSSGGPTGEKFEAEFLMPIQRLFCEQYETTAKENPKKWDDYMKRVIDSGMPFSSLLDV